MPVRKKQSNKEVDVTKCYEPYSLFAITGKNSYTVWSGPLVNKGQELFPICLRSSSRPYLPFKLWVNVNSRVKGHPVNHYTWAFYMLNFNTRYNVGEEIRIHLCNIKIIIMVAPPPQPFQSFGICFCIILHVLPLQAWEAGGGSGHAAGAGEAKDSLGALFLGHLQNITGRSVQTTCVYIS